nr:hypothetical protein CFP56_36171 [Quercus suber]
MFQCGVDCMFGGRELLTRESSSMVWPVLVRYRHNLRIIPCCSYQPDMAPNTGSSSHVPSRDRFVFAVVGQYSIANPGCWSVFAISD